jgi:hypothetical protein
MRKIISRARKLSLAMRDLFKNSSFYRWITLVSFLLVLGTLALPIWLLIPNLGDEVFIPLHYNIYFGIDRFGPWNYIFILPAIGFLLLIVNVIFESIFVRREHVLSVFFAITTIIVETILFGSMMLIVLMNT